MLSLLQAALRMPSRACDKAWKLRCSFILTSRDFCSFSSAEKSFPQSLLLRPPCYVGYTTPPVVPTETLGSFLSGSVTVSI